MACRTRLRRGLLQGIIEKGPKRNKCPIHSLVLSILVDIKGNAEGYPWTEMVTHFVERAGGHKENIPGLQSEFHLPVCDYRVYRKP